MVGRALRCVKAKLNGDSVKQKREESLPSRDFRPRVLAPALPPPFLG